MGKKKVGETKESKEGSDQRPGSTRSGVNYQPQQPTAQDASDEPHTAASATAETEQGKGDDWISELGALDTTLELLGALELREKYSPYWKEPDWDPRALTFAEIERAYEASRDEWRERTGESSLAWLEVLVSHSSLDGEGRMAIERAAREVQEDLDNILVPASKPQLLQACLRNRYHRGESQGGKTGT